ncbi:uncharacterized protein B0I36DRAFT_417312 [Microdochium trichocladiopsis]|uniref:NACHT-NTPase sigma domain-containing protein n=1 Tax=Microdochium trichocladiopsis TaxID=1682393 RepID=A0A9P9BM79_9PEZI|nr:uncharacterized protein B0I36DRAFT_417312 [Microdochium trichocladiopsis]KAH7025210.1 hypothetical protein B0I36DRAFT_417312 [Microdochium trichocladiopsis]
MWQGSHGRGGEAWGGCRCAPTAKGARGAEKSYKLRLCYGPGDQCSAPGGTVNISKGSGNQFPEGTFSGAHSLVPILAGRRADASESSTRPPPEPRAGWGWRVSCLFIDVSRCQIKWFSYASIPLLLCEPDGGCGSLCNVASSVRNPLGGAARFPSWSPLRRNQVDSGPSVMSQLVNVSLV